MIELYLFSLLVGGAILVGSIFVHDHDGHDVHGLHEGLHMPSLRVLGATMALFGAFGGLLHTHLGVAGVVPAVAIGVGGGWVAHQVLRKMRLLEGNAILDMSTALFTRGEVYIPIPGGRAGAGKILLCVQGRTVEVEARTAADRTLQQGEPIEVVEVCEGYVEVTPVLTIERSRTNA